MDTPTKLTTVKIIKNLYSKFKQEAFESDMTLQKVVNRTLHMYATNEDFRYTINHYMELESSGSQF